VALTVGHVLIEGVLGAEGVKTVVAHMSWVMGSGSVRDEA